MQGQDYTAARSGAFKVLRKLLGLGRISESIFQDPQLTSGLSSFEIQALRCEFCTTSPEELEATRITEKDLKDCIVGMSLDDGWRN